LTSKWGDPVDVSDVDGEDCFVVSTEAWPLVDDLGCDDIRMILVDPPKLYEINISIG